jgi:class 3 adenylate cyclase
MAVYKRIPKFHGLRIYMTATLLYIFLVLPIALILLTKYGPDWMEDSESSFFLSSTGNNVEAQSSAQTEPMAQNETRIINDSIPETEAIQDSNAFPEDKKEEANKFTATLNLMLRLLIITFLLGLIFNLPFKIYFSRLRKNKPIKEKLRKFVKRFLLRVPIINTAILFVSYGFVLFYMLFVIIFNNSFDEIIGRFYFRYFFISALASILTLIFVFYWERHRVHIKYLEYVFTLEELKKRIFKAKAGKIANRLWVASGMTALLPLFIVIFYIFLSLTSVGELKIKELSDVEWNILLGKYVAYFERSNFNNINQLVYVNVLDSILMLSGIFSGTIAAIIYILFFVNWTTSDIVQPVWELLRKMKRTGKGEMDQFSIVRTNDEIGILSEGYNDMSEKIKSYIAKISKINEANSRFVPKQFLEFLGKDSIADINLGDQVQQEMTVMFCDIRDFTGISEDMTPRENFNFINNYLGYMEPIIRKNTGFVDKYIGDSIMALFSERAEDALNAAIEMRIKLIEFNQIMEQFGKPPINNGFGIHTGNLMLGIVGGEGRMDGTVISDAVNLSSRLEGLTKMYGASIIISEDTLIRINDPSHYNYRFLDIVKVKGKKEAVYIFEILDGEPTEVKNKKIATKAEFGKALQLYKNKKFETALEIFINIYSENPADKAAYIYINRCKKKVKEGVPDNWDGIEKIEHKFN